MTSPSPSEFLTFHRYAVRAMPRLLRRSAPQSLHRPTPRFLSTTCPLREKNPPGLSTNSKTKTDMLPDDEHSVNKAAKGDDLDVQTSNVKDGMDSAHKSGTGGNATEARDSAGGVEKAKREHPEAPDPAIGMQDERGGRGG